MTKIIYGTKFQQFSSLDNTKHYVFTIYCTVFGFFLNSHFMCSKSLSPPNQNHFSLWTHLVYRTPYIEKIFPDSPNTISVNRAKGAIDFSERKTHVSTNEPVSCPKIWLPVIRPDRQVGGHHLWHCLPEEGPGSCLHCNMWQVSNKQGTSQPGK